MLREVLERRMKREELPGLILIDGGRQQLRAAEQLLESRGLVGLTALAAIAKNRDLETGRTLRAAGAVAAERIFLSGRESELLPEAGSPAMQLLQRLRDEAHRFALDYHRDLRRKESFRSRLTEISGVGPKRRKSLLAYFGSYQSICNAEVAELAACPMITPVQAEKIYACLAEER